MSGVSAKAALAPLEVCRCLSPPPPPPSSLLRTPEVLHASPTFPSSACYSLPSPSSACRPPSLPPLFSLLLPPLPPPRPLSLLRTPEVLHACVKAMVEAAGGAGPVSVKMRSGCGVQGSSGWGRAGGWGGRVGPGLCFKMRSGAQR